MSKQPSSLFGKLLVWIKQVSNHIFALLRYGRINVIALFLIYFALWYLPQGQDILVGMPETHMRVFTSFLLIFALALLNWYFPRLFYPVNEHLFDSLWDFLRSVFTHKPSKPMQDLVSKTRSRGLDASEGKSRMLEVHPYKEKDLPPTPEVKERTTAKDIGTRGIWAPDKPKPGSMAEKHEKIISQLLPRVLGISTFLILAGGLLLIYMRYNLKLEYTWLPLWLTIGMLGLAYGISFGLHRMKKWLAKSNRWLIIMTVLFISMGLLGVFGKNDKAGLLFLSVSFILAAIFFGIFVTCRMKIPYQLFDDFAMASISFWIMTISFVSFITLNFFPSVSLVFPLNALLQGLIFYIGLSSLLVFLGKSKQTYFLSLFIISAVVLASIWKVNLHEITTTEKQVELNQSKQLSFDSYLSKWIADRKEVLPDSGASTKYPLFIVTGEGGGSRAAYWTNLSLGALHEATGGQFQDHCLAITTVSGSSFGAAVHLAQLYQAHTEAPPDGLTFNQAIIDAGTFEENYLSTSLVHFMGTDFWRTILPPLYFCTNKHDRAYALENEWSKGVQKALERMGATDQVMAFQRPYLSHYYSKDGTIRTDLPLYLPNTTHVGTGNRSVVSPVNLFDQSDHATEIFEFQWMENRDLPLAAAALISARFPYINPGGLIPPDDQFVDGGYFENIGGVTAEELLKKTESFLTEKGLEHSIEVHLISIFNSNRERDPIPVSEKTDGKLSPQALVPVNAIANTPFSGHTNYWPAYFEGQLEDRYHKIYLNHDLEVEIEKEKRKVIMPLARYLSRNAGTAIQANAIELKREKVFQKIVSLVKPE